VASYSSVHLSLHCVLSQFPKLLQLVQKNLTCLFCQIVVLKPMSHLYNCLSDKGYTRNNEDRKQTMKKKRYTFIFLIGVNKDEVRMQEEIISWYYGVYSKAIFKDISSFSLSNEV